MFLAPSENEIKPIIPKLYQTTVLGIVKQTFAYSWIINTLIL